PELRQSLVIVAGASTGLGDFLKRRPDQWSLFEKPLTSLPKDFEYLAMFREAIAGLARDEAAMALRVAYRRQLCRLALWDSRQ
ncbi:MAG: hypothetical protein VW015_03975, partial [Pontimonas sp.]